MTNYIIKDYEYLMFKPILKRKKDKYDIANTRLKKDLSTKERKDYEIDEEATVLRKQEILDRILYQRSKKSKAFNKIFNDDLTNKKTAIAESSLFFITAKETKKGITICLERRTNNQGLVDMSVRQDRYEASIDIMLRKAILQVIDPIYLSDGTAISK